MPIISLTACCQTKQDAEASVFIAPRGGATIGSMEPETLVKAFCGLTFLLMNTGPQLSNEMYGVEAKYNDGFAKYQMGLVSFLFPSCCTWLLHEQGVSVAKANQVVYAIFTYQGLSLWLGGTAAQLGFEAGVQIGTALCAVGVWAMSQDFSATAIKGFAVLRMLSALQLVFDPEGKHNKDIN